MPIMKSKKNVKGFDSYIEEFIEVSDELFGCYENFNVYSQIDRMKNLSKKDLYLLLCVCLDRHDYKKDPVVKNNLMAFKEEMKDILEVQNSEKTTIKELEDLIVETHDSKISTSKLGKNGERLPNPKEKLEVRDLKLEQIIKSEENGK